MHRGRETHRVLVPLGHHRQEVADVLVREELVVDGELLVVAREVQVPRLEISLPLKREDLPQLANRLVVGGFLLLGTLYVPLIIREPGAELLVPLATSCAY